MKIARQHKTSPASPEQAASLLRETTRAERGVTLIECLIYIGLLVIIVGLAWAAFSRALDSSHRLQDSASDISRALDAGERWREDVRQSSGFACSNQSQALTQGRSGQPRHDQATKYGPTRCMGSPVPQPLPQYGPAATGRGPVLPKSPLALKATK